MVDYCTSKRDIVGAKRDLLGMFQMVFTPAFVVALLGMEMQVNIACKALVRSADAANLAESARALTFFEALSLLETAFASSFFPWLPWHVHVGEPLIL